jgi:uncharacterized membrane protein
VTAGELLAWLASLALLAATWPFLPWRRIADTEAAVIFVAVVAVLVAMRFATVALLPGLSLHFLGVALSVLMFGWSFGLIALALATAITALLGGDVWLGLPHEFLFGAALPAIAVWGLYLLSRRGWGRNPFVYFLAVAFGGGAISIAVAQGGKALLMWLGGDASNDSIWLNYLVTMPAMMFAEGFLTGGAMTILSMYRPRWVATFDDEFYLRRE